MKKGTLRHVGVKVDSIEQGIRDYTILGFEVCAPVEKVKVQKMKDKNGGMIELIEGNYNPHIAVNWFEDTSGNLIEVVREDKKWK